MNPIIVKGHATTWKITPTEDGKYLVSPGNKTYKDIPTAKWAIRTAESNYVKDNPDALVANKSIKSDRGVPIVDDYSTDYYESKSVTESSETKNLRSVVEYLKSVSYDEVIKKGMIHNKVDDYEIFMWVDRANKNSIIIQVMKDDNTLYYIRDIESQESYKYAVLRSVNAIRTGDRNKDTEEVLDESNSYKESDIDYVMREYVSNSNLIKSVNKISKGTYKVQVDDKVVTVKFDPSWDEYVYTIDGKGPYSHRSYEFIARDIHNYVKSIREDKKIDKCCICGAPITDKDSHNASPVKDGRCCTNCNNTKVIPERISRFRSKYSKK